MYKYIMARLTVNLTLLGVLAALPLSQGHGLVATVARSTEDDPSPARSYHLHVQFVAGATASTAKNGGPGMTQRKTGEHPAQPRGPVWAEGGS